MNIRIPKAGDRTWRTVQDLLRTFRDDEVVEMVMRYCDQKDSHRKSQEKRNARLKVLAAFARENPELLAEYEGTRVSEEEGEGEE